MRDARRALGWYTRVLGARVRGEPVVMPGGRIGHAEISLAGGALFVADEHPDIGFRAPEPGGTTVSLVLTVPDLPGTVAAAVSAGAKLDRGPYEAYGYRNATVTDPFGHRWMLQSPIGSAAVAHWHGDIGYASLWVPDGERAAVFYASVLGWEYAPEQEPGRRQVTGTTPAQGLWGGVSHGTLFCSYVVEDAAAAVARVRTAGGQAREPVRQPYGLSADCVDDQGIRFAVHEPPGTGGGPRPEAARDGDLAYVTIEVPDSPRAREFCASVLGWHFVPGRAADGWQVEDVRPMTGISGSHVEATGIPLWRVTDLPAAVARVRVAGGLASEPRQEPYGLAAQCTDDQGIRFQLCQFP